jgi:hypothetical protein
MADLLTNLAAVAGAAGGENLYIEDVFSTYLYTGNGSTQTITNGIDLDGEGGLVWIKGRSTAYDHILTDTERGVTKYIQSNTANVEQTDTDTLQAFNADGFGVGPWSRVNNSGATYASWTFRKAPKFFDVVTYTGDGVAGREIAHNLGSAPGMVIVKSTSHAYDWECWHRALPTDYVIRLNETGAAFDEDTYGINFWNDTAPTSTHVTLGDYISVNNTGYTYVMYVFAHDAGGFGDDGEQNVISCGSFTATTGNDTVTLGYEPQWLMVKKSSGTGAWYMMDSMRGLNLTNTVTLIANTSGAEDSSYGTSYFQPTATGFIQSGNFSAGDYIYIAIRRGPMKTPESGTEVFTPIARTGTGADAVVTTGTNADLITSFQRTQDAGGTMYFFDKLRGNSQGIRTGVTNAEAFSNPLFTLQGFGNTSYSIGTGGTFNGSALTYVNYSLTRAPGFFDEVCYTGTGSATTFTHNLTVVPELMIVKRRSTLNAWAVYAGDNTDFLVLNTTAATADNNTYWNDTSPTSTVFSVGTNDATNASASTYVAYLFASLAGVSDIGTYTGNGTSVSVTTGFQPRFILVKRTDSTGNWIVGDSARGLVAGDDPFLELNTSDAEVTNEDWVDVSATGFTINETAANANVNTATYLYLAIS